MSRRKKLVVRFCSLPKDLSFKKLESLLEIFGFKVVKTNAGSHFKWVNQEKGFTYMAPRKNPMKVIYLKNYV